jgi:hypothetical protein
LANGSESSEIGVELGNARIEAFDRQIQFDPAIELGFFFGLGAEQGEFA